MIIEVRPDFDSDLMDAFAGLLPVAHLEIYPTRVVRDRCKPLQASF